MRWPKHAMRAVAALLLFVTMPGCKGFFVNPTLTSMTVGPAATIAVGSTVQMYATGTYSDGSTQTLSGLQWSSSDQNAATVSTAGLVTGVGTGTSTITGSFQTASSTASVTVDLGNVTALTVTPSSTSTTPSTTVSLQAFATANGSQVDVSTTAQWTWVSSLSSDTTGVTIDSSTSPVTVNISSSVTAGEVITVTATYASASSFTATSKITVN